jgi:hypothetical protein
MKNSLRVLSRGAYGYSSVTIPVLSRRPSLCSAVASNGHSAVRPSLSSAVRRRLSTRVSTDSQHGLKFFQHRLNLSALILQADFAKPGHAASSAPAARSLETGGVHRNQRQIKNSGALRP